MLEVEPGLLGEVETLLRADDDASESKTKLAVEDCPSRLLEEVESAKEFPEDARMDATS